MLYLAEVQKRPTGFGLGGGKTDLKLLACQRSENNWLAVPGEEVIPADEAKEFSPGALVLVDLDNNKQVLQIQDAGRQLVKILQNFSRFQEKSKIQWEEIEQWKASLTFQAQELNRREVELQAKEEQVENLQTDINKLEHERQEISQAQQEFQQLQKQIERNREELETAGLELQRQKQELEQHQGELGKSAVLNQDQYQYIQDLLSWLTEAVTPADFLGEKLTQSLEIVNNEKESLEQRRKEWENTGNTNSNAQQEESKSLASNVQSKWLEWQQAQESLVLKTAELRVQEALLASKQEYSQVLNGQIGMQTQLYEQLSHLMALEGNGTTQKVNVEALEKMPLHELEELVQNLRQDLHRDMSFVKDQEEELALQLQEMDALQRRIDNASEYDRINWDSELSDEKDRYRILNESLVGSQRNLKEREEILSQHQAVLWSRLDNSSHREESNQIYLAPILLQVKTHRQELREELQKLEVEIQQIQTEIRQKEEMISGQAQQQAVKKNEIKKLELSLREKQEVNTQVGDGVVYQEVMLPLEGHLEQLRQQLQELISGVIQVQGIGEQVIQLRQVIQSILVQPSSD
ncbi:MAG: pilus motility taxis protein HmpF [Trichodesmium sp. St18_bin1]|nr:pilus motility taxis protein HmpF [Trichodesmium sp. St18_bin1]MDE5119949.1 pilus motility taxis protein HmpF [Trichodesmium sp. St19_bin1]